MYIIKSVSYKSEVIIINIWGLLQYVSIRRDHLQEIHKKLKLLDLFIIALIIATV